MNPHAFGKNHIAGITLCLLLSLTGLLSGGEHLAQPSTKAVIAGNGQSAMPIVVAESAEATTRAAARDAAQILSLMTGGEFKVVTGDGASGIAIGTAKDFPALTPNPGFDSDLPDERQGYEIIPHGKGIAIVGATAQGAEYGVWDFLYRLGYRRFFPSAKWEIIPKTDTLVYETKVREIPDYFTRRIRQGYGLWSEQHRDQIQWEKANREGGYVLRTGHAYGDIVKMNQRAFREHPEYFALVNGQRTSDKFCVSNPALRRLVAKTALRYFEKSPVADSFSVEPSDGGGWCECAECRKLGPPSTQIAVLANETAIAVRERFAGKRIGIYAYNHHSPPPLTDVDRDVVVSVATAFLSGGLTLDEILGGWKVRKAVGGIREYYSVFMWAFDLPGRSRASNFDYLSMTIPKFHRQGARYMIAETSDDWGASGLGYYLAARFLWNMGEIGQREALIRDFLEKSYGPAAPAMEDFHRLLNGAQPRPLSPDLIGRMYRALKQALDLAGSDEAAAGRIADSVLYTRYCELYLAFDRAEVQAKEEAFRQLADFVLSIRDNRVMHSYGFYRERKRIYSNPGTLADENHSTRYTAEQIAGILENGIKNNPLFKFEPVSFSDELLPAPSINRNPPKAKYKIMPRRNITVYYTWVAAPAPLELEVTGGLIPHYRDRGNVRCELWNLGGASEEGERESLIQTDNSVPPDGIMRKVKLSPRQPGLHKIVIRDGGDKTLVNWQAETPMTIHTNSVDRRGIEGMFFFYVPKGTRTLGFFASMRRGDIRLPDGKTAYRFVNAPNYYSLEVPQGMDGKVWTLANVAGQIDLLTVPPYIAISPAGLLLPKEVVARDRL